MTNTELEAPLNSERLSLAPYRCDATTLASMGGADVKVRRSFFLLATTNLCSLKRAGVEAHRRHCWKTNEALCSKTVPNKYIMICWCLHESSRRLPLRPGFEPSSNYLELRSTSRGAGSWVFLSSLDCPDPAAVGVSRGHVVSLRGLLFLLFGSKCQIVYFRYRYDTKAFCHVIM